MNTNSKIYIAGHQGMVGSAIVRKLQNEGYTNLVYRTSKELDLTDQSAVKAFFESERPEYVFLAAAKVGGINANNIYRGQFLYENLMIEANVIHQAYTAGVEKLLFLGSSCIYPKFADQPIHEDSLLTGALEPTNEPYAIAKIAGIKLCETYRDQYGSDFISAMPTNLYGLNDNYDLNNSHVLPALIRKFHSAKINGDKEVVVWGTGSPLREFLHVDDLAEACFFLMENYSDGQTINVGFGSDLSIKELAETVKAVVGFEGKLVFDASKPDGTPKKLMDSSRLRKLGWKPKIDLLDGIRSVYDSVDKSGW
ncbi:GDP-L-fucose synthase [Marinoscillum furvescens]|uniref:GDP-L-fucose synthase n=1 Tax=Marinoscillum furvescens DSM 4134 TaxID=1122208 RepID=A0A3D9L624_MARFU|nr:GDP-L-fucose synthase [Marinoscillum furvescens]REE01627.1 GDP-L-fucose synthase [Marinoscillum furvescens DSM 4134]